MSPRAPKIAPPRAPKIAPPKSAAKQKTPAPKPEKPKRYSQHKGVKQDSPENLAKLVEREGIAPKALKPTDKIPGRRGNPNGFKNNTKPFKKGNKCATGANQYTKPRVSLKDSFQTYLDSQPEEVVDRVWAGLTLRAQQGDTQATKLMVELNGESIEDDLRKKLASKGTGVRVEFLIPAKEEDVGPAQEDTAA